MSFDLERPGIGLLANQIRNLSDHFLTVNFATMAEWETHDASATGSATDGWNNTGSGDNEWDGNNNVDTGNFGNDGNDGFGNGGGGEGANRDGSGDRACFNCGEIG